MEPRCKNRTNIAENGGRTKRGTTKCGWKVGKHKTGGSSEKALSSRGQREGARIQIGIRPGAARNYVGTGGGRRWANARNHIGTREGAARNHIGFLHAGQ